MNPIAFLCIHCSQPITVPPDASGRAVPCPHCKQAVLVPAKPVPLGSPTLPSGGSSRLSNGRTGDQGPDFTETLRKAREATDSIFHEQDDDGDSLFGGNENSRKLIVPATPVASYAPVMTADPYQQTLRVPGLPDLPPIATQATPVATRATFVPPPLENPFEDLATQSSLEGSSNLQSSDELNEEEAEESDEEFVRRPFPWKNALLIGLGAYALLITVLAAWGWLRTPEAAKAAPSHYSGKR